MTDSTSPHELLLRTARFVSSYNLQRNNKGNQPQDDGGHISKRKRAKKRKMREATPFSTMCRGGLFSSLKWGIFPLQNDEVLI